MRTNHDVPRTLDQHWAKPEWKSHLPTFPYAQRVGQSGRGFLPTRGGTKAHIRNCVSSVFVCTTEASPRPKGSSDFAAHCRTGLYYCVLSVCNTLLTFHLLWDWPVGRVCGLVSPSGCRQFARHAGMVSWVCASGTREGPGLCPLRSQSCREPLSTESSRLLPCIPDTLFRFGPYPYCIVTASSTATATVLKMHCMGFTFVSVVPVVQFLT